MMYEWMTPLKSFVLLQDSSSICYPLYIIIIIIIVIIIYIIIIVIITSIGC